MKLLSLSAFAGLLLMACEPGPDRTYCPQTVKFDKLNTGIDFEGYTPQETDTVAITSYVKGGMFQQEIARVIYLSDSFANRLSSDYDYDIFVIGANRHHRVWNIVQAKDSTFLYTACAGSGKNAPAPYRYYWASSAIVDGERVTPTGGFFKLIK